MNGSGDPDVLRPEAQRGRDCPGVGRQVRVRQPDGLGRPSEPEVVISAASSGWIALPAASVRPSSRAPAVPRQRDGIRRERLVTRVEHELWPVGGEQGLLGGEVGRSFTRMRGEVESNRMKPKAAGRMVALGGDEGSDG